MLSAACPACGRPRPVSLATPDRITCPCGYSGPPHPDVQQALTNAAARLRELGVRDRFAGYRSRDAKLVAFSAKLRMVWISVFFGILAVAAALVGPPLLAQLLETPVGAVSICTCSAPLALLLPAILATVGWARRKTRLAQRAIPPEAAGAPPRCRVCGAPITLTGAQAIATCDFCQASNVVTADVRIPRELQVSSLESYAAELAVEARAVQSGVGNVSTVLLASLAAALLLGPVLGCVMGSVLSLVFG